MFNDLIISKIKSYKILWQKILISSLFLFSIYPVAAQTAPLITEVEAETGELNGVSIASANLGFSGTGYVTGFDNTGDKLSVKINIPEKGFYKLVIRYNGSGGNKYQKLFINGKSQGNLLFPETQDFSLMDAGNFLMEKGENSITIEKDWGWTDIDKFEIYEAEKTEFNIDVSLVDKDATEETKNLYEFLKLQFGHRLISGQTTSYFTELKNLAGKTPMINNDDLQSYTEGYSYKWINGGHGFGAVDNGQTTKLINWYKSTNGKGIAAFQWHWHSPSGGKAGTNTFYTEYTNFDIRVAVTEGTDEYNMIIRDIDAIAVQLKKFQDAKIPVVFRPLHEAGGGWFWWGAKGAEPCKKLYNIIFDRIKNYHQIHNLIWVWSTPETAWYPGNDKVDIIGHDSYPGSFNYGSQKATFDKLYVLTNGKKLIAMTENGPIPNPDECFDEGAHWLWFMSWSNLVKDQNSVDHIKEVFNNQNVLSIESNNARLDNNWRSKLYPENWKPGFKDSDDRFLHDFSYAGYHQGEKEVPHIENNIVDVTKTPYNADNTGATDVTLILQKALNDVGQSGGGVVYLPAGTYKVDPGSGETALRIQYNNIVLRGAGTDSTFIYNSNSNMRQKNIIWLMGDWCTWATETGTVSKTATDLMYPTRVIPVKSVQGFAKGDDIILRTDGTPEFIAEHNMSGIWTEWAARLMFLRKIDSINVEKNIIYIDSPTRYFMKTRDNARVYHAKQHITECGIENLSIGNQQNDKQGWDEETYIEPGTGAYEVHASQAIFVKYAQNCWVKNVNTYKPSTNSSDIHVLSNCLLIEQSRGVTVDSCFFQKPQYEGGGGNGYMFTLQSNDCIIKNSRANDGRHNYDFKFPYSNGNVIYNCIGENSKYASDFHMYLSMANLIDNFTVDKDYLESSFRPYGGDVIHGYSSTQSVFYNTTGKAYHPDRDYIIESRQFKHGYVIGTSGAADKVKLDPVDGTMGGYNYKTTPRDFVEGIGKGDELFPKSLYLDQLERRLNDSTGLADFEVTIKVIDFNTNQPLPDCKISILNMQKLTDNSGSATFEKLSNFLNVTIEKNFYKSISTQQFSIYSDTTLTYYLVPNKYNVIISVSDKQTGDFFLGTRVTLNNEVQITNEKGETYFEVFPGDYDFLIDKNSYQNESGSLTIISDTTFHFELIRNIGSIKFKLVEGTNTPVNNAKVVLGTDTLISTNLGIAHFKNLDINTSYNYLIFKSGYNDLSGMLNLNGDTTVTLNIEPYSTFAKETHDLNKISLWPNPASETLNIKIPAGFAGGTIEILSLQGTILRIFYLKQHAVLSIGIDGIPSGLYLIKLNSRQDHIIQRFVKI